MNDRFIGFIDFVFKKKVLIKRWYHLTQAVFSEISEMSDQKTIRFNPYCLLRKFQSKDNTVQPILSFWKSLTKRQYGSANIVFTGSFDQKRIRFNPDIVFSENFDEKTWQFNPYCLFRMLVLTNRQYSSAHIVFSENSDQKTIQLNPYCFLRKFR